MFKSVKYIWAIVSRAFPLCNNDVFVLTLEPSQRSEVLNAYNKVTEAGVPLQPELHKYVETKLM